MRDTNGMTRKELVDAILKAKRLRLVSGEDFGSLLPLMPAIVMDAHYCIFHEDVDPLVENQHSMAKYFNNWKETWRSFNSAFFRGIEGDYSDVLVDIMDDFSAYIHNDLVRLRVAVMKVIPTDDHEVARIIASAYLCQVLALCADTLYTKTYRQLGETSSMEWSPVQRKYVRVRHKNVYVPAKNHLLRGTADATADWYVAYMVQHGIAIIPMTKEIHDFNDSLCKRIVQFTRNEDAKARAQLTTTA